MKSDYYKKDRFGISQADLDRMCRNQSKRKSQALKAEQTITAICGASILLAIIAAFATQILH